MLDVKSLYNPKYAKSFRKGMVVERAGCSTGCMYIVLAGEAGVYKSYGTQNEAHMGTEKTGGFFAEADFLLDKPSAFSFIALTDLVLLEVNKKNCAEIFKLNIEAAFEIMKIICARMEYLNKEGIYAGAVLKEAPAAETAKPQAEAPAIVPDIKSAPDVTEALAEPPKPEKKESPVQAVKIEGANALFPEGHGSYELPLAGTDGELLFEKSMTCPICRKSFKAAAVKSYKIAIERTDSDMRVRYKGIEPSYYDVVTCPDCIYSALSDMFATGAKSKEFAAKNITEYKPLFERVIAAGTADAVFIKYYLALICAPLCFKNHQLTSAKLWLKLSRLYADCQDEKMEQMAAQNAFDCYMYSYESLRIPPNQNQQLCTMIGEMGLKLGNYKIAKDFFFKAKVDKMGTSVLKDHADDRINELRQLQNEEADT